jgi:RecB family endonuclease NucS
LKSRELNVHRGTISEETYESSIAAHAEKVFGPGSEVIQRQGTLDSGRRFDLLIRDGTVEDGQSVIVVEVKARTAKAEDVAQLLAYVGELRLSTRWRVRGVLAAPGATTRCAYAMGASYCSFLHLHPVIEFELLPNGPGVPGDDTHGPVALLATSGGPEQ